MRGIRKPVFILGCPRSGTTYLGRATAELPGVSYYFEPPIMKYYTRLIHDGLVSGHQARRFYRRCAQSLLLAAPGLGERFVEKNPKHTWIADTLIETFPDALFIVITRDGRDVCASLSEKPWHREDGKQTGRREPGGYLYGPYPHFYIEPERRDEFMKTSDTHRCIWIWRRYAEQIERVSQYLPEESQFHIRYESLVLEPETIIAPLLRFLGEDDEESTRRVSAYSQTGHGSSVGRWRGKFGDRELKIIEEEAGPWLQKLDYTLK